MMTFDRVVPELLHLCHDDPATRGTIEHYAIVRDVRGRVRLVVQQEAPTPDSLAALQQALVENLGSYFVAPILSTAEDGERRRLAVKLLDIAKGKWPAGWPREARNVLGGGATSIDAGGRWTGYERTIGKEAWLSTESPRPPWPLVRGKTPPIVTFHSFKGGVGRTTLVAAYAVHLARRDKPARVAIVDLDLEAPGVGELFGVATVRGTLDVLVDGIATGSSDLTDASATAQVDDSIDAYITVFPGGRVNDLYVQKLARLDFSSAEPDTENPVGVALAAMLMKLKASFDVILLDSRAGLHDLAGMSLHGLAHVDVLVFRGTAQNLIGLEQTLRTLGSRGETRLVLAETLLPASDEELYNSRRERTRLKVYDLMCEHIYEEDNPPQLVDVGGPHDVVPVRRREWLDGLDSLRGRVVDVMNEPDFARLAARIDDECRLEPEVDSDLDVDGEAS